MTAAHALSPARAAGEADRLREVVARITARPDEPFVSRLLPGGLTNLNYRVTMHGGHDFVVRLSSPQSTQLGINRAAEHANSRAAAAAGVAPQVLGYLPDLGALALEWIEGPTFTASDLDSSQTLRQVARLCLQLHEGPRFASDFDMFEVQQRYLAIVLTGDYRRPDGYLEFMPEVSRIQSAMAVRPEPTVPCHNDLLPANIMAGPDRLWFIDFEYAGNGDPCFDLGNLCSEAELGTDRLEELVAGYYGAASAGLVARTRLYALMSNYGWTLWACIQAATSDLDFDFWGWGLEKYERAVAVLRGPDLASLIHDVQET